MQDQYNIILEQEHTTVVAKYTPEVRDDSLYQSEAQLEKALIKQLCAQGYDYPKIKDEKELIQNLRVQLEVLNKYKFSEAEWKRLFDGQIANEALSIEDKTTLIQQNHILNLLLDDGTTKNIKLIDKQNIHNNKLQVINQYVPEGGSSANRYDVTILVNGLPLVHIELKRRGISIREAFNQINRYQRESFWAGKALFEYAQVFVISNGTQTKYYSNTTRFAHEKEADKMKAARKKIESNSFEFTSYWSDAENNLITDLNDFAKTFLSKHSLLNILTKYCVFTVDRNLLVMRPYQIAATERILLRIQTAIYNKWQGTTRAGGYIWHTTGSGKTLTSFKTAQLATRIEGVEKVLFVVDRQDLDYQTMHEYNNFEEGCANSNADGRVLLKQLNNPESKIIITTIQKLSSLLKRKTDEVKVLNENIVMIFDECHRSQFGKMHQLITKKFKKYFLFGFTGTPIFAVNANKYGAGNLTTTAQVFGGEPDDKGNSTKALHTYTIVNAINDKNVLKFKVDYVRTVKAKSDIKDEDVWGIDEKGALMKDERIRNNVAYVLKNFDIKTKRSESYAMSKLLNVSEVVRKGKKAEEKKQKVQTKGFNSIFAADSVPMAIKYYDEFRRQIEEQNLNLRVATIFTFAQNEDENDEALGLIEEDPEALETVDITSKEALNRAIKDYNKEFGTSFDTSGDKFMNYYKELSLRMKNKEIDILIVVGMFLTGFDAKTLNTLWVDKGLKMHGLLQAYSRTNRILNAVKDCGNIVCFRNLEERTNECFRLFGDENAGGVILMRPFKDYYFGYEDADGKHHVGYKEIAEEIREQYPVDSLHSIIDEERKKQFVKAFGNYLKAYTLLTSFDEFNPDDIEDMNKVRIIKEGERQDYLSWYNDLYEEFRPKSKAGEKVDIDDDLEFEIELVKQVEININYILMLVQQYHDSNCKNEEIVLKIRKDISASPDMRDKKELIEKFIERITPTKGGDVYAEWQVYVDEQKKTELDKIIADEKLKPEATYEFVDRSFDEGFINENGTAITKILPPMPLFGGGGKRAEKKMRVIDLLKNFLTKYIGITDNNTRTISICNKSSINYKDEAANEEYSLIAAEEQ